MFFKIRKLLFARFILALAVLGGLLGTVPIQTVYAATLTVTNTNDTGPGSLRQAIVDAASGDTITFDPSLAGQTITLASDLIISKDLTIDGSSLSTQVTISGGSVAQLQVLSFYVTATISNLTITDGDGGGIVSRGNLTILNSTLKNNYSSTGGAAINSSGTLKIRNSTITQNQSQTGGGAIQIGGNSGDDVIVNTTVTNNTGGIYVAGGAFVQIINSTFAENSGSSSWLEIFVQGSSSDLVIDNSIFVCTQSENCYVFPAGVVDYGKSILGVGTLSDFGLAELADNGGPTQTMALLPGSPLIDGGDDSVCGNSHVKNLDQRGVARPQGSHCDIGAYEVENSHVDIYIGGGKMNENPYQIPPGGGASPIFLGSFNGPVEVKSTNERNIIASERAIYGNSFTETLGMPGDQLATEYWFSWYDGLTMRTWISIGAPTTNAQDAQVDLYIGDTKMNQNPYVIPAGGQVSPTFPGTFKGPVRVVSTNGQNIIASERAIFGNSFTETLGMPGDQLATEYWFSWYDGMTMRTWISVGAPTTNISDASVDIYIGDTKMNAEPYVISPGGQVSPTFPGTFKGPVRVVSTNGKDIIASERAIFGNSFTETLGMPDDRLTTEYWFSWYDGLTMSTWVSIGAPTTNSADAQVDLYIGDTKMNQNPYVIPAGGQVSPNFAGTFKGPVRVVSTNGQDIIASERAIFGKSFTETLGMPDDQLTTDYWFSWYDGLTMSTWISVGAP